HESLGKSLHESLGKSLHESLGKSLHESITSDIRAFNQGLAESHRAELGVIDDQYKDLPGRVKRLEETVFPPSPRVRRKRRAS
ncbi:MAG: hypothetical protein ABI678_28125, partial [Kofleriaceae bacterium]